MWPGWLCLEQSISLGTLALADVGFLLIGACVGYILSAGRERKGICSSAFQPAVFLCVWCFYSCGLCSIEFTPFFLIYEMSLSPRQMGGKVRLEAMEWVICKWSWIYWAPVLPYLFVDYLWVSSRSGWAGRKPTIMLYRQILTSVWKKDVCA